MVFIYIDYALLNTLNCPGNYANGVFSVAFDSTYLLASGSWTRPLKSGTRKMVVCCELSLAMVT